MYEIAIGYVVGSAAALLLFRTMVREHIVKVTLDMLINEEYVRAYEDDDGITQLYTWRESVDLDVWEQLEQAITEMADEKKSEDIMNELEREIEDGKDDTP